MDRSTAENPGRLTLFDDPLPADASPRRRLLLAGRLVEFGFARRRRHTIGIRVDATGLAVSAPPRAPWREIEAFLREKQRWIVSKIDEWAAAGRPRPLFGQTGEKLPLSGDDVTLDVREGRRAVTLDGARLLLELPEPHRRAAVRELLVRWLKLRTLETLAPRAAHYAARLRLQAPAVAISNARTQWGVCAENGRVRLSWRLAHLEPRLADYVVAHEVAHLVELNHSRRFWALVESLYPDWRAAREAIERAAAKIPIL